MHNRLLTAPILCALVLARPLPAQNVVPAPAPASPAPATAVVPAPTPAAATTITAKKTTPVPHTISYTVVKGDTLTGLAKRFNTTRKHLVTLNDLPGTKITPGQVLLIPSTKKAASATAGKTTAKPNHTYLAAQPVQDFDVPASTFASCPVPLPSPEDDDTSATNPPAAEQDVPSEKPAPIAKLVSPAELEAEEAAIRKAAAAQNAAEAKRAQAVATTPVIKPAPPKPAPLATTTTSGIFVAPLPATSTLPRNNIRNLTPSPSTNSRPSLNPFVTTLTADQWGDRFIQQARALGDQGIDYDDSWRPPGENRSWAMDCSNTSRYLYKVTANILLPRTASDQYYYLHLQGKAWDVPVTPGGWADTEFLRRHLRPGDLLFWENTYRPERQPPITHVMIFLGTNVRGQWIMAGSQSSRGGEHNRSSGGPDIYAFNPTQPSGGYSTWLGMVHHHGRFCAYGRPLEADAAKLAMVAAAD